jgi:predicted nucleic acid-binding protein
VRFLLDANIVSEKRKPIPTPKVENWLLQNISAAGLSVVTIGEFTKGACLLPPGELRRSVEAWIEEIVEEFTGRILPLGLEEMKGGGACSGRWKSAESHSLVSKPPR